MKFDPFGLAGRFLPETVLHELVRGVMALILVGFLVRRIGQYGEFLVKPLWLAETVLYGVLIVAYLFRTAPVNRSSGLSEIAMPLIGSVLPFALVLTAPAPAVVNSRSLLRVMLWLMAASTLVTVWGVWTLRRSFSITVEARQLVTSGPYRLVRHPVYCGEIGATAAVATIRFSVGNLALLLLFIFIQLYRTRLEEAKLRAVFPEYAAFAGNSRWFWR